MMLLFRRFALGLLAAFWLAAPAMAEEFRVGFVNTDRILRETNVAKAAQAKLESDFSRREKELNDQAAALKASIRPA